MKRALQGALRAFHESAFDRGLPRRLALYFHALEPQDYDAFATLVEHVRPSRYHIATDPDAFLAAEGRVVWFSFDDNYRSWHTALPLLDRLGVRGTFYVNTAYFRDRARPGEIEDYFDRIAHRGERVTLSTEELRELAGAGHEIGAHTHTHPVLAALPFAEAREEVRRSKAELEALLGRPVRHFSYPYGMRRHFTEAIRRCCLEELGLATVANAIPAMQHARQLPGALQRSVWHLEAPLAENLAGLRVDGRVFERLTGRSAVG